MPVGARQFIGDVRDRDILAAAMAGGAVIIAIRVTAERGNSPIVGYFGTSNIIHQAAVSNVNPKTRFVELGGRGESR